MELQIITEIFDVAVQNVDLAIVAVLIAVGFMIKHVKFLEKVPNDIIPLILLILSFIFTLIKLGISLESIISAIITAASAIGLHQQGKFSTNVLPNIIKLIFGNSISIGNDIEETNEEEQ